MGIAFVLGCIEVGVVGRIGIVMINHIVVISMMMDDEEKKKNQKKIINKNRLLSSVVALVVRGVVAKGKGEYATT